MTPCPLARPAPLGCVWLCFVWSRALSLPLIGLNSASVVDRSERDIGLNTNGTRLLVSITLLNTGLPGSPRAPGPAECSQKLSGKEGCGVQETQGLWVGEEESLSVSS